jgi:multiple sugar transport system permease protein
MPDRSKVRQSTESAEAAGGFGLWFSHFTHRYARFIFPAPAFLVVGFIIVYPVFYTGWMSLQEWFASSLTLPKFIGTANYQKILFGDPRFKEAFFRTLYFTLIAVTIETALGVSMAVLFNREFWGKGLVRTLSILPMMATPTAISLIFVMMYHPTLGVMNYLLTVVGLPAWTWTYSSKTALYAIALVDVWEWTPLIMLIAMAGLAALPKEPYESALIDGASPFQCFYLITLPLLRPTLVVAILFRAIDALKTFDIIFVMTQGGPSNASETINILLFNQAFSYFNMGYASSMAVALFAIVMGASLILMKVRRVGW